MTGIIILAAGSSSRLGQPKQNLIYQGQTLLQRAVEAALSLACGPVLVILGANENVIKPTIENGPAKIFFNNHWEEGMASSIRLGIVELIKVKPAASGLVLMLCDQPFVNADLLQQVIENKEECGITACGYNGTTGVPVYLDRFFFDELLLLEGKEGAKKLLSKYEAIVSTVPFPLGNVDIDTIEDIKNLEEM